MRKLIYATAVFLAAPAAAQDPGSRESREFVQQATESDTFEIMASQSALAESKDPQVRAFAQRMIGEHQATSRALQDAAARAGLQPPPPHLSTSQSEMLASLQSQRGREFDQVYARQQALAHRSALVVEQGYAANGDAPALRQVATSATPVIAGHLTMADQLKTAVGAP